MSTTKVQLFTRHSRHWRENKYVYPVISRRSEGLSIGVNLNPDASCNFDCIYCCVDRTVRRALCNVDLKILGAELDEMLTLATSGALFDEPPLNATPRTLRRLNDVAFSGDGEPTSFPRFPDACRLTTDLLARRGCEKVKIVVITNATLLTRPTVVEALRFLDRHNGEVWAKLDAGTEAYYRLVERTSIPLARVLDNLATTGRERPIAIQSLFMEVHGQPPGNGEIAAYVGRLRDLIARGCQIKLVQIYTVARRTAEPYVTPLADASLDRIADLVRAISLPAKAFYTSG